MLRLRIFKKIGAQNLWITQRQTALEALEELE